MPAPAILSQRDRTVFVHIGPHKCGSTAIQAACAGAREALAELGYHYPAGDPNHSKLLATLYWDEAVARRMGMLDWIDDPAEFQAHRAGLRQRFLDDIAEAGCRHLILSGEELSRFTRSEAARLVEDLGTGYDRVRIIAYARDPARWVVSNAQQILKWEGATLDEVFDSPPLPQYRRRFLPYLLAPDPAACDIRPYRDTPDFDVVADFFTALGLGPPPAAPAKTYPSVSWRTATLLSAVNGFARPFVNYRYNPTRSYRIVEELHLPGPSFTLPQDTMEALDEALARERADLASLTGQDPAAAPPPVAPPRRRDWFGDERAGLEAHALAMNDIYRRAQNEAALRALLRADADTTGPEARSALLSRAWAVATDRQTLSLVRARMRREAHPEIGRAEMRQRILRRIEAPRPGDPPLVFGNPLDRF